MVSCGIWLWHTQVTISFTPGKVAEHFFNGVVVWCVTIPASKLFRCRFQEASSTGRLCLSCRGITGNTSRWPATSNYCSTVNLQLCPSNLSEASRQPEGRATNVDVYEVLAERITFRQYCVSASNSMCFLHDSRKAPAVLSSPCSSSTIRNHPGFSRAASN